MQHSIDKCQYRWAVALWLCLAVASDAQTDEVARVIDGAGGRVTNTAYTSTSAVGQPCATGSASGPGLLHYSGFLQTFVAFPGLDHDDDSLPDENDPDDDNDGLSDADELAGTGFDPAVVTDSMLYDTDRDGMSDGDESASGTNPQDALSLLRILSIQKDSGRYTVTWQSRGGWTYEVAGATSVFAVSTSAVPVGTAVARGGEAPWYDTRTSLTNVTDEVQGFYRVRALAP